MKFAFLLMLTVLTGAAFGAEPSSLELRQENDRLRRENATLKMENAKLKADLAKATADAAASKPALPKATHYTAEQIVKLLPPGAFPARGDHSIEKYNRARKVLAANMEGEWVRMETRINQVSDTSKGNTSLRGNQATTLDQNFFTDFQFDEVLPNAKKYDGQVVSVIGKVKGIGIHDQGDAGAQIMMQIVECKIVK